MTGSETGAVRSGSVLKRERVCESNMWHVRTAGDHKVLLLNELLYIYIYSTDRLSEAGKVWVCCSQNINAAHLSTRVRCNSKHVFFGPECVCLYGAVCVCGQVNPTQILPVQCIWMTLLQPQTTVVVTCRHKRYKMIKWTQSDQKLHSARRRKAVRATYNVIQEVCFYNGRQKGHHKLSTKCKLKKEQIIRMLPQPGNNNNMANY